MDNIDYALIKTPIIIFIASLLFALLGFMGVNTIHSAAKQEILLIKSAVSTVSEKLEIRLQGIKLYQQLHTKYSDLTGFSFSKPDKLRWMERINSQGEKLQLPSMTYNIKARHINYNYANTLSGDFTVFSTAIDMQMGLVHEEQLLQLFQGLNNAGLGLFSVEHCAMAINGGKTHFTPNKTNITAQCLIEWYEIDKRPTDAFDDELGATP
ncbi:MAG: hypothetical protein QM500_08330 [Methylococcales bacterium]